MRLFKHALLPGLATAAFMLVVGVLADTVGPGPYGRLEGSFPQYPAQPANMFYATPSNGAGTLKPRLLVPADLPFTNAGAPTSTLGTVAAGSTNNGGQVTGAASGTPTSVDVVFAGGGWPNNAWCVATPSNSAAKALAPYISAQSKTGFTITFTGANSAAFNYNCEGS